MNNEYVKIIKDNIAYYIEKRNINIKHIDELPKHDLLIKSKFIITLIDNKFVKNYYLSNNCTHEELLDLFLNTNV